LIIFMRLIPIKTKVMKEQFDLFKTVKDSIIENKEEIIDNDILVISSKFVSMSQGMFIKLDDIVASTKAKELAERYTMDPRIAEIVIRESDAILGGIEGFLLAVKNGVIAPNAGIDKSNIVKGYVITYPKEPFKVANDLRRRFKEEDLNVGIVFNDSRLMPSRRGTIGVAIAVSGFKPVRDLRGKEDLFGNKLRVTLHAIADSIATAANLLMGESNEATPIVIVRDLEVDWDDKEFTWQDLAIEYDQCIYIKGLSQ